MLTPQFLPFPELRTKRLDLLRIKPEHLPDILLLRSDRQVMQYVLRPLMYTIDEAKALLEKIDLALANNEGIAWGIFDTGTAHLTGSIGFWRLEKENDRAEIGYMLAKEQQGKGLMQEALTAVLAYGFDTLQLHSIEANTDPENTASIKLLEKNGFRQEGSFKENVLFEGRYRDTCTFGLLRKEYTTKQKR